MQVISLKVDESLLKEIDGSLEKNRYATRTEFIRDAIRQKLIALEQVPISEADQKRALDAIRKLSGSVKRKTTDAELRAVREGVFDELVRKHGSK